jgi:hypothetical protein
MDILGLVDWESIPVSTELMCLYVSSAYGVAAHLMRQAAGRGSSTSPRLVALKTSYVRIC